MDYKKLLIVDAILLFGFLSAIFFLVGYTPPLVISPLTSEYETLLFVLPSVDYILIDDNSRFNSPETIFINETISLKEGKYFIKFFDGLKGEIREINLELTVVLQFRALEDGTIGVFNLGDSTLQVDVYETGSLINSSIAYTGVENE
ncbi:MAG: hypothetical protein AABX23_02000 [Nanoarchaeota archaeon]